MSQTRTIQDVLSMNPGVTFSPENTPVSGVGSASAYQHLTLGVLGGPGMAEHPELYYLWLSGDQRELKRWSGIFSAIRDLISG